MGKEKGDKMKQRERESGRRRPELPVRGVYKNVRMEGAVRVRMGE